LKKSDKKPDKSATPFLSMVQRNLRNSADSQNNPETLLPPITLLDNTETVYTPNPIAPESPKIIHSKFYTMFSNRTSSNTDNELQLLELLKGNPLALEVYYRSAPLRAPSFLNMAKERETNEFYWSSLFPSLGKF